MRTGGVNMFLSSLGFKEINFMGSPALFPHIYVWSGIWQGFGAGSIIYVSALSAVDPGLHEAAIIDGANMWQRLWHIDLATIKPIIVIGLILGVGGLLGTSVEKVLMLQNEQNMSVSETISVYVWRVGLTGSRPDYSYATAIGLFQNIVGLILTLSVNKISKVLTGEAYWF
jgi:multiple sugar transport system permease protein/putative aldouronate transport system permease protein